MTGYPLPPLNLILNPLWFKPAYPLPGRFSGVASARRKAKKKREARKHADH
jgi:hypothetical protein